MGSGASKKAESVPPTASSTQRSRPSNSRRADFQEVQVRPSGQDPAVANGNKAATLSTGDMSARQESSRESGSSHRNRYARHAADPSNGGSNSLQHGQSAA
ncbi:hypothetical protein EGW08_013295, partial [Elysia chlorotica]